MPGFDNAQLFTRLNVLFCVQPHGLSPGANVTKECGEEASIPEELARNAKPVGAVSYEEMQESGLKRDVLFCYDLQLPADFVPAPQVRICPLDFALS